MRTLFAVVVAVCSVSWMAAPAHADPTLQYLCVYHDGSELLDRPLPDGVKICIPFPG